MHYVVFDLEFNQDFSADRLEKSSRSIFEIIQIGAVKLDQNGDEADTFQRYVKPVIYPSINPFITELTGITSDQLETEETFPSVYLDFVQFAEGNDSVFCVWGMADLKELFGNIEYHKLDQKLITKRYINLQPYAALHLDLSQKKLMKLKTAAEHFSIPLVYNFHNALHDAYYTAEIFKRIHKESILPKRYEPGLELRHRPRQAGLKIDFEKLIRQFEKMYARELTSEEQSMVKLAYHMGKTRQFLK